MGRDQKRLSVYLAIRAHVTARKYRVANLVIMVHVDDVEKAIYAVNNKVGLLY